MMSEFIPSQYHTALKWLGQNNWIDFLTKNKQVYFNVNLRLSPPENISGMVFSLIDFAKNSTTNTMFVHIISKALSDGPKVFCPTFEQCLALENTELNISFENYRQPYPVTFIKIPKEYKKLLVEKHNSNYRPSYVANFLEEKTGFIASGCFSEDTLLKEGSAIMNSLSPVYDTIEDGLMKNRYKNLPKDDEFKFEKLMQEDLVAEKVQRIGMNFSLMMTLLGTKIIGPLGMSQQKFDKFKGRLSSNNAVKREQAKRLVDGTMFVVEFEQKIDFFETRKEKTRSSAEGFHASPKPHWRRGHFRMQPYGPKNTLKKLKFIKPIMVMKELFVGDLSDTSATYNPKD